jgi:hypothetical protein
VSIPVAKAQEQPALDSGRITLAERLFVASWRPERDYKSENLARQCLEAAEAFERARREHSPKTAIPFAGAKAS